MEQQIMTDNEMISVIIPVYNVEKYLDKCIRSVVKQTYKNLEIILVDDGSPDQCGALCDKWAEKDERIRVIHKANGGLSDARNAGLDVASGVYIGFVDSDDYIHPEMYQRLYEKIKKYNGDMAVCGFYWVDEQSDTVNRTAKITAEGIVEKKDAIKNICFMNTFIVVWNKLYKKELFFNLRFQYGKFAEDLFIMPNLYNKCKRIISVFGYYYYYVETRNSICRREKTIWHLDNVEACYRMMMFCKYNGYSDLLPDISVMMIDNYIGNMEKIKRVLPHEKQRLIEIKKMAVFGVLKYGQRVRIEHKLYILSPVLYRFLLRSKRRLCKFFK